MFLNISTDDILALEKRNLIPVGCFSIVKNVCAALRSDQSRGTSSSGRDRLINFCPKLSLNVT